MSNLTCSNGRPIISNTSVENFKSIGPQIKKLHMAACLMSNHHYYYYSKINWNAREGIWSPRLEICTPWMTCKARQTSEMDDATLNAILTIFHNRWKENRNGLGKLTIFPIFPVKRTIFRPFLLLFVINPISDRKQKYQNVLWNVTLHVTCEFCMTDQPGPFFKCPAYAMGAPTRKSTCGWSKFRLLATRSHKSTKICRLFSENRSVWR